MTIDVYFSWLPILKVPSVLRVKKNLHFSFVVKNPPRIICGYLKLDCYPPKKLSYLLQWKAFKKDEKCFYLDSSLFWRYLSFCAGFFGHEENGLIWKSLMPSTRKQIMTTYLKTLRQPDNEIWSVNLIWYEKYLSYEKSYIQNYFQTLFKKNQNWVYLRINSI